MNYGMNTQAYAAIVGIATIVGAIIAIVAYIFSSIGLYSIAKRRGIKAPGLAWVPVGSMWILGSIADQFDYVRTGAVKAKRKVLLWLTLVLLILGVVTSILVSQLMTQIIMYAFYGYDLDYVMSLMAPYLWILILPLASSIIGFVAMIIEFICLHKLYKSCKPHSATVLTVFSVLFSIIIPFAIFGVRKHDDGMYADPAPQTGFQSGPQYNPYMNQQNFNQPNMNQPNFNQPNMNQPNF